MINPEVHDKGIIVGFTTMGLLILGFVIIPVAIEDPMGGLVGAGLLMILIPGAVVFMRRKLKQSLKKAKDE